VQDCEVKSADIKRLDTEQIISQARKFRNDCDDEVQHSEQVTKLSIMLFEKLHVVHHFGSYELFLLTCAAILHDIGWVQGQAAHHKASMQMIYSDKTVSLTEKDRKKIAAIARYHRKALPKPNHALYKDLTDKEQRQVSLLAGILRVADGLDRSHMSAVKKVDVNISNNIIEFCCATVGSASSEMFAAQKKADLFEISTGYKTRFSTA
jgi:exopolyphosphatase/guanosine-5'-triphosphate,3'-diphosphate pyrophosphatase